MTDSSISCAIGRKARGSKKTAIVGQEIQQQLYIGHISESN